MSTTLHPEHTLSNLEAESIEYFVSFVQILGMPKSLGQIYGLLFVSDVPLAMDHIVDRLELSKGSVSQGLTTLKGLGAIVPKNLEGDRREHYVADLQVSRIVSHFFEQQLEPRLSRGEQRLESMIKLADDGCDPEDNETLGRLKALSKWQKRGSQAIPMIKGFLRIKKD